MQPVYAIKHIPTGHYLPEPTGRSGRGGSHTEPVPADKERPRLFYSELSAKRALTAWLQGKHVADMGYEYDEYSGSNHAYQEGVVVIPQAHRIREDMRIMTLALVEQPQD